MCIGFIADGRSLLAALRERERESEREREQEREREMFLVSVLLVKGTLVSVTGISLLLPVKGTCISVTRVGKV